MSTDAPADAPMGSLRLRLAVGAPGVVAGLYGAWLVLTRQEGFDRLLSVVEWLAGGVLLHDVVIAPVVLALAWLARRLPETWHRPTTVALVVMGTLTLAVFPVLGRFGARADNDTLMPRPYLESWMVLLVITVALVVGAALLGARRTAARTSVPAEEGGDDGPGAGGR